ncbi:MAG: hypothetical protein AAF628_29080 [Planctomycetota bacterium]
MSSRQARCCARIGLLGNPSDGFGGKVLGLAITDFMATATLLPAKGLRLRSDHGRITAVAHAGELPARLARGQPRGGAQLLAAAVLVWSEYRGRPPRATTGVDLAFETEIPRRVGLSGSSAIIIAALRALAAHEGVTVPPHELAELALRAEVDVLGIAAGPQDRVIQAYQGLMFMDFAPPRGPLGYRSVDTRLLPPLFLAWDPEPGESSNVVHSDVRQRFAAGDPEVVAVIHALPKLAAEGLECLQAGDLARLAQLFDHNFDLRARIWSLRPQDVEMVKLGRAQGAAVKFAGSGGAVVGVPRDPDDLPSLHRAYWAAGYSFISPTPASAPAPA